LSLYHRTTNYDFTVHLSYTIDYPTIDLSYGRLYITILYNVLRGASTSPVRITLDIIMKLCIVEECPKYDTKLQQALYLNLNLSLYL